MASVSDLIKIVQFKQQEKAQSPLSGLSTQLENIATQVKRQNENRRKKEMQSRLSDILMKNDKSNFEPTFKVDESGAINVTFKSKGKAGFASEFQKSIKSVKSGETTLDEEIARLVEDYPKQYNLQADKHFRKVTGADEKYDEDTFEKDTTKEPLVELRAEGFGRIGKGAKYEEAVEVYGKEGTDKILDIIRDLQSKGKTFDKISKLMKDKKINSNFFLKYYR